MFINGHIRLLETNCELVERLHSSELQKLIVQ